MFTIDFSQSSTEASTDSETNESKNETTSSDSYSEDQDDKIIVVKKVPSKINMNEEQCQIRNDSDEEQQLFLSDQNTEQSQAQNTDIEQKSQIQDYKTEIVANELNDSQEKYYQEYFCKKIKRAFHIVSSLQFEFVHQNSQIFSAKTHGISPDYVYISEAKNVHIKTNEHQYYMKIANSKTNFTLFTSNDNTKLLKIVFTNKLGKGIGIRNIEITFVEEQKTIHSREARNKNGKWYLDFGGKFLIPSKKNAIILDKNEKMSILVKKTEKNVLSIETVFPYKPIYLFALGIASFICEL